MSDALLDVPNGVFIQGESEVASVNMVMGAAAVGRRAMTSSSSPGISLKQEGFSYIACMELPCLVMNVVRAGPGLGNIAPHQGDYFQSTKGGGHGDYRLICLAPNSVQEMAYHAYLGLELACKYRNPSHDPHRRRDRPDDGGGRPGRDPDGLPGQAGLGHGRQDTPRARTT